MKKPLQLRLWCNACHGTGKVTYKNFQHKLVTVPCPKCKTKK